MSLKQCLPEQVRLMQADLRKNYADLLPIGGLWQNIGERLQSWQHQTKLSLLQSIPFELHEQRLMEQKQQFHSREISFSEQHIGEYKPFCQAFGVPFDGNFWHEQLNKKYKPFCQASGVPFDSNFWHEQLNKKKQRCKENPKRLAWRLMLEQWQKQLDQAKAEWYLQQINQLRQKLMQELAQWLDTIRKLSIKLNELGLDTGLLLDNSIGKLTPQDIEVLKRWLNYLQNDENSKKIAELIGKMRQIEQSEKIEQIQKTISVSVPTIDINSREEIIGVRLGRELEYILPSELALMSDPETTILFDLKYLENKLMCFELQGIQFQDEESQITVEQKSLEDEKAGPMILCVDTSGSMQGLPENIAKAMALHLANKAKTEKRDCFIINFSTQIETFEINQQIGIADLIYFLRQSFHGGTDVAPALRYALNLMQKETYQKADLLLISDFVMTELSKDLLENIEIQRKAKNKFNSLVIGDHFMSQRLKTHFDHEWIYNPYTKNIQELVQFKNELNITQ